MRYKNLSLKNIEEVIDDIVYIEEWKPIKNYEGVYEISSFGRIKSVSEYTERGKYGKVGIMKQHISKKGYCRLSLRGSKKFQAHVLVALHFIDNPENKSQVNHIDTVKTNNFYKNLEWNTSQENIDHAVKNSLHRKNHKKNDIILINKDNILKMIEQGDSYRSIGKKFNVTHKTIKRLIELK